MNEHLSNVLFFLWFYAGYILMFLTAIYFIFIKKPGIRHQCADMICVKQSDGTIKVSPFYVIFPSQKQEKEIEITINGELQDWKMYLEKTTRVPYFRDTTSGPQTPTKEKRPFHHWVTQTSTMLREHVENATHSHEIIIPSRSQLDKINEVLKKSGYPVVNIVEFSDGERTCEGYMYFYNYDDKLIVSDIDGTITKSDLRGHIATHLDKDYTHIGTANLFHKICENGYKFIYLSARPVTMAKITRQYISKIKQDGYKMPVGPVITSPNRAMDSFIREVVIKEPHILKISILSTIGNLFPVNPYVAGFGNRETDAIAYSKVGIDDSHVFIINKKSMVSVKGHPHYKNYLEIIHDLDTLFPDMRDMTNM